MRSDGKGRNILSLNNPTFSPRALRSASTCRQVPVTVPVAMSMARSLPLREPANNRPAPSRATVAPNVFEAFVTVRTEFIRELGLDDQSATWINTLIMPFAAMSGPVYDAERRSLDLCSLVRVHQGEQPPADLEGDRVDLHQLDDAVPNIEPLALFGAADLAARLTGWLALPATTLMVLAVTLGSAADHHRARISR